MKKILLFSALFMLCWGLKAQRTALLGRDAIQVTPDTLHLYFFACSPHLERVTIANPTDELICINRVYAENFRVDFLLDGNNLAQTGTVIPPYDTLYFDVYASPINSKDIYGDMIIETDESEYHVVLFYETNVSVKEEDHLVTLYPNPANEFITIQGEKLGRVHIYNSLGQLIDEYDTEESTLDIPTSKYANGIYFIKANNMKERRFVVAH
jgi:hypothetical protein